MSPLPAFNEGVWWLCTQPATTGKISQASVHHLYCNASVWPLQQMHHLYQPTISDRDAPGSVSRNHTMILQRMYYVWSLYDFLTTEPLTSRILCTGLWQNVDRMHYATDEVQNRCVTGLELALGFESRLHFQQYSVICPLHSALYTCLSALSSVVEFSLIWKAVIKCKNDINDNVGQ